MECSNPMLNPVVLAGIVDAYERDEEITTTDILQFRTVCSAWNMASSRPWRRIFTQLIVHEKDDSKLDAGVTLESLQRSSHGRVKIGLNQLLGLIKAAGGEGKHCGKLFCNFELRRWTCDVPLETRLEFWKTCGPCMKRLCLVDCALYDDLEFFRSIVFSYTPNLRELKIHLPWMVLEPGNWALPTRTHSPQTKLEKLEIISCAFVSPSARARCWPLQWKEVFQAYPNLKTLSLRDGPLRYAPDEVVFVGDAGEGEAQVPQTLETETILAAIAEERKSGSLRSLVNMELIITPFLKPAIVGHFREAALSLESLTVQSEPGSGEEVIREMLGVFASSLQSLEWTRRQNCCTSDSIPFQNFLEGNIYENLKNLRFSRSIAVDLSFLQNSPNLEKFHIHPDEGIYAQKDGELFESPYFLPLIMPPPEKNRPVFSRRDFRMTSLTEFKTPFWIDEPESLSLLTTWLPNISRLSVPLGVYAFQVVCVACKDTLRELHFPPGTSIDDEDLTGVRSSRYPCRQSLVKRPANISNLQGLERFSHGMNKSRSTGFRWSPMIFTEHAVIHGFQLLPKLKSLQLFVDGEYAAGIIRSLMKEKVHYLELYELRASTPYKPRRV